MAKQGPTGWDIANLGVDLYQTRQIKKMHKDMEEATNTIQLQMFEMKMAQEMEAMKKDAIIEFRKLVLVIEEELGRIRRAFSKYPAHSVFSFDILNQMINEANLDSDFFEEFQDIERAKAMEKSIVQTKNWIDSRMTPSIAGIKEKMMRYATEEPELTVAIEVAQGREELQSIRKQTRENIVDSQAKWEKSQPEWEEKQTEIESRRAKLSQTAKNSILLGIGLGVLLLSLNALLIRLPEAELQQYFSYILYGSWAFPLLMWLNFSANPVIPRDDPLILLRDSIGSEEARLVELDDKLSDPPPNIDGRTTAAELIQLKAEWLGFVDKNSPRPDEAFETSLQPESPPPHPIEGPPGGPSTALTGQVDEHGREWIEYPPGSDRWHYRQTRGGGWTRWRG